MQGKVIQMARDPRDPNLCNGESEYGWGAGLFPPGVAETSKTGPNRVGAPDFGARHDIHNTTDTHQDNYARAVADRRTDPTDPNSGRDFTTQGNPDRYGGQPPLVRAGKPKRTEPDMPKPYWPPLKRQG